MLSIYFKDEQRPNLEYIHDVERAFGTLKLRDDHVTRHLINKIEHGKFLNSTSIIDRFGDKLSIRDLSTGCKAAIVIAYNPDKLVNISECGLNARDAIINIIQNGNILMKWNDVTVVPFSKNIDCLVYPYRIRSVSRLNKYLCNERPFNPDMGEDIELYDV